MILRWLKKIYFDAYTFVTGFFLGMKKVNDETFTQVGYGSDGGTSVNKQIEKDSVSRDLLRGEVTKQVEELRYRTYLVDREAKKYDYFSPFKAIKTEKDENKSVKYDKTDVIRTEKVDSKYMEYDKSDGLKLITIQPVRRYVDNVLESIEQIEKEANGGDVEKARFKYEQEKKYNIEIERDNNPRFKIEEYTTRLVVKEENKETDSYVLDFYVSKYPISDTIPAIYFVKECESIMNGYRKSDMLDILRVKFITSHAYKLDDLIEFRFDKIFFRDILEYDGHYILKFRAHAYVNAKDTTDELYSESMAKKYENKEKKDRGDFDVTGLSYIQVYHCDECGKEIVYNPTEIDEESYNGDIKPARDLGDEPDYSDENSVLTYIDLQIAEQAFGKKLCKECLAKYLQNPKNLEKFLAEK